MDVKHTPGRPPLGDGCMTLSMGVRMSQDTNVQIRELAKQANVSIARFVGQLIEDALVARMQDKR